MPHWIRRTIRGAAWLPMTVLFVFAVVASALNLYVLYSRLDVPTHFAAGIVVTHFFRNAAANAQESVGGIPPTVQSLLALGLTMIAAVVWELLEYASDVTLGTAMNHGVADTLSDLFFGLLGGACFVVYRWYAMRRVAAARREEI